MIRTLIISYEKTNEGRPVMYVEESGLLSNKVLKMCTFTGEKAEQLYKELTGQAEARKKMPHSLRARLSGLRYKKIISDKDYDRLCKALDNEKILDNIRTEIVELWQNEPCVIEGGCLDEVLEIIDKYKAESEV